MEGQSKDNAIICRLKMNIVCKEIIFENGRVAI